MSRLKHDYSTARNVVDGLGGLEVLEAVKEQVRALDLPTCPFCGGEAIVGLGSIYSLPCASVECGTCHNMTLRIPTGLNLFSGQHEDIHDVVRKAALRWSRREGGAGMNIEYRKRRDLTLHDGAAEDGRVLIWPVNG